ncbi:MAG: hypothetical protein SFU98_10405 [Leptospiraceae bacterium]|nr:hypothetical protein [Leptospiraceae bacterium]
MKQDSELVFEYGSKSGFVFKFILAPLLVFWIITGSIMMALSIMGISNTENLVNSVLMISLGFFSIMLGFFGFIYRNSEGRKQIYKSYFDTNAKRFYIETRSGQTGYIPFNEIESIEFRSERRSKTIFYVIYLVKKDGAFWDFKHFNSETEARKLFENLKSRLSFVDNSFDIFGEEKSKTRTFEMNSEGTETVFKWNDRVSTLFRIITLLLVVSVILLFIVLMIQSLNGTFSSTTLTIIFGVPVLSVFLFLILRSYIGYRSYELSVSTEKICLYGIRKEKKKLLKEIPMNEVYATEYGYSLGNSQSAWGKSILLVTKELSLLLKKVKLADYQGFDTLSILSDIRRIGNEVVKLPFEGHTAVEILEFERELDKVIQEKKS